MQDVAIYGAGGLGRELAAMMHYINTVKPTWNLIGFFDDGKDKGAEVSHFGRVLGGITEINAWDEPLAVVIGVGSPMARKAIREKIRNSLVSFPNLIHPDFKVADPATFCIGEGNVITSNCGVTVNVTIGNYNLFNGSVGFGHDVVTGDYNVFMPSCSISGEVHIGDCNLFGGRSFVIQQIKIGSNVRLGAGSVLMTKPRDGRTYIGVPAKRFYF